MQVHTVKMMKVKDIQPSPDNPRMIKPESERALKKSLQRYGLVESLIWNKRTEHLVGGHQRLKLIEKEGIEEVPVVVVDLPEDEEKALNITLNSPEAQGMYEVQALQEQLEQVANTLPDAFDELNLIALMGADLEKDINTPKTITGMGTGEHPEMALQPYEHYDYLVFFFKDVRDFMVAAQLLGIGKVDHSLVEGKKKIGLGRCLDGKKILEILQK